MIQDGIILQNSLQPIGGYIVLMGIFYQYINDSAFILSIESAIFTVLSFQKNIIYSYAAQIVSVVSGFFCMILAARMLGAAGQGDLALYNNFTLFSVLLLGIGMPAALVHFIAAAKIEKEKVASVLSSLVIGGLAILALIVIMLLPFPFFRNLLPVFFAAKTSWFVVLFLHLFFLIVNTLLIAILQAEQRFSQIGFVQISSSVFILCLYAFKYFFIPKIGIAPIYWILISLLLNSGFQCIYYLWVINRCNEAYFRFSLPNFRSVQPLLQFAFLAFATNTIQFLSYRMDIWFLNHYHGREITGVYALSASLVQMIWLLPSVIQSILYGILSTQSYRRIAIQKTKQTTKQIALYAFPSGIIAYGLAYFFLPALFGEAFSGAVQSFGILLFGVVPFCLSMGISAFFAATARVSVNLHSALIGFVVCLIADLILIPAYGIKGAAFASVFSYLSTLIYLFVRFQLEGEETKAQSL